MTKWALSQMRGSFNILKSNENEHADTENRIGVTRGEGVVEGKMDKGDQLYGDGRKVNFWW